MPQRLITERHVGVTNNPTIFASALAKGDRCTDQLRELRSDGRVPTTRSSRLPPLTSALPPRCSGRCSTTPAAWTNGVSIEVDPRLARDTAATVETAHALADAVDRPNVHVRIPGTAEALPAITVVIAAGISVNVTLIFSLQRYRKVIDAYLTGLERAAAALPLARIHSVASFFVFRVDTEVDARLDVLDSSAADALKGRAGVANARLAHQIHKHILTTERWQRLAAAGAHPPRPLWASTGVKDPAYPDTMYVTQLITSGTSTPCQAPPSNFADHGVVPGDTIAATYPDAQAHLHRLTQLGVDLGHVTELLETQGLAKFEASWDDLAATTHRELQPRRRQLTRRHPISPGHPTPFGGSIPCGYSCPADYAPGSYSPSRSHSPAQSSAAPPPPPAAAIPTVRPRAGYNAPTAHSLDARDVGANGYARAHLCPPLPAPTAHSRHRPFHESRGSWRVTTPSGAPRSTAPERFADSAERRRHLPVTDLGWDDVRNSMADETRSTVLVALAANTGVAIAKLLAGVVTGSAAMLSEAARSVADTVNEVSCWSRCDGRSGPLTAPTHLATARNPSSIHCSTPSESSCPAPPSPPIKCDGPAVDGNVRAAIASAAIYGVLALSLSFEGVSPPGRQHRLPEPHHLAAWNTRRTWR